MIANGKFALAADPDNPALKARMAEAEKAKAEGRFLIPSTIGEGRRRTPSCVPASRPRALGQDGGRGARGGVPGSPRMEKQVLTVSRNSRPVCPLQIC